MHQSLKVRVAVEENLQRRVRLRPVDLARPHGLSTQAVRNYEEAGILPAAERTESGYRTYTPLHAHALATFLALLPGHGHGTATDIMRAVNRGAADEALLLIDESHAQLLEDRRTLRAVESALRALGPEAGSPGRPEVPPPPSSGRWRTSSAFGPPPCARGRRPGWSARAATR